jgi:acyl dehydratase
MAGKTFEELTVGAVFEHEIRRTVTETDNLLFSAMSGRRIRVRNQLSKTEQT